MKVVIANRPTAAGPLVVGCFEGKHPETAHLPGETSKALSALRRRADWSGRFGEVRAAASPAGGRLVCLVGLGSSADLDGRRLGKWIARGLEAAEKQGHREVTLALPAHPATAGPVAATRILRQIKLYDYSFDLYKKPKRNALAKVSLLPPPEQAAGYRKARGPADIIAAAAAESRDLANTPPNVADPAWMAGRAADLAAAHGMKADILGPDELAERGMGGLLAVGGGSERTPRLVRLEWGEGDTTIALVGKGVTFDTGGISIKPSASMEEMKYDKCGACAVLGIARGAAQLDLPFRFRAYLALAENMPDGKAYRPGDIVRCYGGKTVEVVNTDAEGRMILADTLAWASEEKPDLMIDYATLTGACVVALGHHGAGLFTPHDELASEFDGAGEASGERVWRLPLWPEFDEDVRGRQADLRNSAGRWGGAATAAAFLAGFVSGPARWAHLDIAGTAWQSDRGSYGATGFGVALTLTWLLRKAGRL